MIKVKDRGSYFVGGKKYTLSGLPIVEMSFTPNGARSKVDPNGEYQAGQMYVQYVRLEEPISSYPVLLCHGGGMNGSTWETTPDGREGWDNLFLKSGFDIFVSDSVERGRSTWARYPEINPGPPVFRTYKAAWTGFRFGPNYGEIYKGQQFPVDYMDIFMKAANPRWTTSGEWTQKAFDEYVGSMKQGCILVSHSTGCLYAERAALKYPGNVKASILLEPAHLPNYNNENLEKFKTIPHLIIWGDYLKDNPKLVPWTVAAYLKDVPAFYNVIKSYGCNAKYLELPDIGIYGNSHMLMMDKNSEDIFVLTLEWLKSVL